MLDAIDQVTGTQENFSGLPKGRGPSSCRTSRWRRTSWTSSAGRPRDALRVRTAARGQPGPGPAPAQLERRAEKVAVPTGPAGDSAEGQEAATRRSSRSCTWRPWAARRSAEEMKTVLDYLAEQTGPQGGPGRPALGDAEYQGIPVQSLDLGGMFRTSRQATALGGSEPCWKLPAGVSQLRRRFAPQLSARRASSGLTGLTLGDLLRLRAAQAAAGKTVKDTSVILIWKGGGPSHIDTWDLKPDAPAEYRGEFKPIADQRPGHPDQRASAAVGQGRWTSSPSCAR